MIRLETPKVTRLRKTPTRPLSIAALAAVTLLAGCSGGGSISLGSGQTADPATVDFPVAYVKRSIPPNDDDLRQRRDATPDADLFVRDRASPTAPERNVTERITGTTDRYDLRDVDVSSDGSRFIFAMRGPLAANQDERNPPNWGIWEYEVKTDALRRVISSSTIAAEGNDLSPHYLPDGRIVFTSTRQRQSQATLRDEGKPGFEAQTEDRNESAFVLHVMKADGTDIHQVSFNQSHDIDPGVLANGRLLWSRWDHAPGSTGTGIHLYTANPDGTDLQLLYGAHSHLTGTNNSAVQFVKAREMPDGRILALIRPTTGASFGGDLALIDTGTYVENTQAVLASVGLSGPAQQRATQNDVSTLPGPSRGGRFNSAFPLWDGTGRILVTWSQCRLQEGASIVACTDSRLAATSPAPVAAAPLYSAWIFDPAANTYKPLFEPVEGVMITDLVAAQPRVLPVVVLDKVAALDFDPALQTEGVGILDIRSVYDFDGVDRASPNIATLANPLLRTADQRPARFLRLEKPVSMPDRRVRNINNAAFGATPYMREILGYTAIEPDGSVRIKVPANVAFQISVLDKDGRRLFPVHRNWLQLRPGETRSCNGCHDSAAAPQRSHGRTGLFAAAWAGAVTAGLPFPGTQARFAPNPGETMAQARARWSCSNENCKSLAPSLDLRYVDEWTDSTAAGRPADAPLTYAYTGAGTLTTALPTSAACALIWTSTCRITINYTQHLQPLWTTPRITLAADAVTVLTDNTCIRCHSTVDAMGAARVPAAQLDLSDGDSIEEPLQKKSYRELLFPDNEQTANMGVLQDKLVPAGFDPVTGLPIFVPVSVPASISPGSARNSTRFFSRFIAGASHAGYLTPAELRLISEWVDLGAQYFNNPFDPTVPLN